jgi:hypothetical protein
MTRFADQLFDDLMREHGSALAHTKVPAAQKRHLGPRPVLLTAGAGGLAVAATVGTLVAGGGTPAYAVTTHPDGTVTLAVYQQSGIAEANAKLRSLGDRVVVVPVRPGCPSITSLPAPAVPAREISVRASSSSDGSATVAAQGVPVGDILVLGLATTGGQAHGSASSQGSGIVSGHPVASTVGSSKLTSGPAPSCVSLPASPVGGRPGDARARSGHASGPGSVNAGTTTVTPAGTGPTTNSNN